MRRLLHTRKASKGAVMVEFAFSALLLVLVLLSTVELSLELHARQATERVANRAAEAYASSRDIALVQEVIDARTDVVLSRCLQPVEIHLFDSAVGLDPLRTEGRLADGTAADLPAQAFRLELACRWPRLIPVLSGLLGPSGGQASQVYAHIRVGAMP